MERKNRKEVEKHGLCIAHARTLKDVIAVLDSRPLFLSPRRRESIVSYSVGLVTAMEKGKLKLFCLPTSSCASRLDTQVIRGDAIRKFSKDLLMMQLISAH